MAQKPDIASSSAPKPDSGNIDNPNMLDQVVNKAAIEHGPTVVGLMINTLLLFFRILGF